MAYCYCDTVAHFAAMVLDHSMTLSIVQMIQKYGLRSFITNLIFLRLWNWCRIKGSMVVSKMNVSGWAICAFKQGRFWWYIKPNNRYMRCLNTYGCLNQRKAVQCGSFIFPYDAVGIAWFIRFIYVVGTCNWMHFGLSITKYWNEKRKWKAIIMSGL